MVNVGEIPGTIEEEQDLPSPEDLVRPLEPDLATFGFESLVGDSTAEVEFPPDSGQKWNIYELVLANPYNFDLQSDGGIQSMQLWVNKLYASTEHYRNSEQGRALRKEEWYKAGGDSDELTTRQKDLISDFVETIEEIAGLSNLGWDQDRINEFALDAWLAGWTTDEIKDMISEDPDLQFGVGARPGSDIAANVANINEKLRQHLMDSSQMDEGWIEDASRRIYRGETTLDILATELAEQSATLYPNFGDRIRAGVAPTTILNSYNPIFRNVFGYTPSWDGEDREIGMTLGNDPAVLSGANFAHYLRTTDEYDRSEAGLNKGYDVIQTMGKALGLVP